MGDQEVCWLIVNLPAEAAARNARESDRQQPTADRLPDFTPKFMTNCFWKYEVGSSMLSKLSLF